ncbi:unnamed protein product [Toxocara canis]|uniref:Uncharacterized protein n=1 Tax=Toxocara canis TaxID=6265 RepID=A0A183V6L4_TOXCA|nr:unnamed protein product [Toxocara canis]
MEFGNDSNKRMPSTSHPYEISPHPKRPRSIFSLPSRSPEFHPPPLRCFSAMESEQLKIDSDASSSKILHEECALRRGAPLCGAKSLDTLYEESPASPPISQSLDAVCSNEQPSHRVVLRSECTVINTQSLHDMQRIPKRSSIPQSISLNTVTEEKNHELGATISTTKTTLKRVGFRLPRLFFLNKL